MYEKKPWLKFYGDIPQTIDYPRMTMYRAVMKTVREHGDKIAYDFMGREGTYAQLGRDIDRCADALAGLGVKKGDRVTIAMPTSPPGVICFYAVNKLGAVASMIHPLSTPAEIGMYLKMSNSTCALTLDIFCDSFMPAFGSTPLKTLVVSKIQDYLPLGKSIMYYLAKGRKVPAPPKDPRVHLWSDIMASPASPAVEAAMSPDDCAVIMYSGGTTGTPKGIMLSSFNFICEGLQCAHWVGMDERYADVLAILPIFHGFGLGVCVNAAFMAGGKSIMVPIFDPEEVARQVRKKRPNFLIGVPTLFEALNRNPKFAKADLGCLRACFCGADSLPRAVKERFEEVVRGGGGNVQLLEGYGLTEAVTAIMANPMSEYREKSIGIPFPDMMAKIADPETGEEKPVGEEGEICVHGPAVMLGYLDQPEETQKVLRRHRDGLAWLHTGDIASMDGDGFFYFKLRQKRMIKSSGMNVYPAQVEEVLHEHPAVAEACVVGVPDRDQVERVKAFVVLKNRQAAGDDMAGELIRHCRKTLIKWSCPREVEFRDTLPRTLVGKIAYKDLEEEEKAQLRREGLFAGD